MPPEVLVTATLLCRNPVRKVLEDPRIKGFVGEHSHMLERALRSYPADPGAFLLDVRARLNSLNRCEAKCRGIKLQPATLVFIAKTHRDQTAKDALGNFRAQLDSLRTKEEFLPILALFKTEADRQRFVEAQLIRRGAAGCEGYLESISGIFYSIMADAQFAEYRSRPAMVLAAILRRENGARKELAAQLAVNKASSEC
jgi:hypothetical protein